MSETPTVVSSGVSRARRAHLIELLFIRVRFSDHNLYLPDFISSAQSRSVKPPSFGTIL